MNKYEVLYIVKNDLDDDAKAAVADRFQDLVESLGGTVENVDKWGTKKFAYPINYTTEGYYILMNFDANPDVPMELERQMKNTDAVVRSMIIRK